MSAAKWIFGGLGFAVGGPIGALIGVIMGTLIESGSSYILNESSTSNQQDKENTKNPQQTGKTGRRSGRRTATAGDIHISILVLIACVIKADGRVLKSEISYIKPFLLKNYGEEGGKQALQLLKGLLQQELDHIAISRQIKENVNYSTRLELIHILTGIANADNEFAKVEEEIIRQIAINLGLYDKDIDSIMAIYSPSKDANWAYKALEIEPSASDDDVKKAYRRMAMKYHPDKVAEAGDNVRAQATEKFRAINEAYKHIKEVRGMK